MAPKARSCFQSLNAIRDETDLASMEARIVAYSEDITELSGVLMTLEMQLVEQLEVRALARAMCARRQAHPRGWRCLFLLAGPVHFYCVSPLTLRRLSQQQGELIPLEAPTHAGRARASGEGFD